MAQSPAIILFKSQLNNLLGSMARERNLLGLDGEVCANRALPYWFIETFLGYTEASSADEITEGFDDLAIDAILISDDETLVHFYQFKNPVSAKKGIDGGDVDKLVSGIELILQNRHSKVSNLRLKDKIEEIRSKPRTGYRIHFVSTGGGLPADGKVKLSALCERWATRGTSPLQYDCTDITELQVKYYSKTLPTLDRNVELKPPKQPYAEQLGSHRSYVFHLPAEALVKLYDDHGEKILQQNIRTSEGDTETNKAIYRTAIGRDSENFYYFNNGVTILCDSCNYDQFQGALTINRPQIVNGGQTVRVLAKANKEGKLKQDVVVSIRVLTSDNDRTFAGNVAVNLNNQTVVKPSFLRSNHPEIIQLAGTLATNGYYLERREGELDSLSPEEIDAVETNIGHPVQERRISLQPACQSYIAFFDTNVEIAKRNPKQIFTSMAAGGYFEKFINSGLTAERFIFAWELYRRAMNLKRQIAKLSREKGYADATTVYQNAFPNITRYLGKGLTIGELQAAAPQSSMFLIALLGKRYNKNDGQKLLENLETISKDLVGILFHLVAANTTKQEGSWPTHLRSQVSLEEAVVKLRIRAKTL